MADKIARSMSFNVHSLGDKAEDDRWHWIVYSFPERVFLREGQITGDRDKADRAARAAIVLMGGVPHEHEQDG